MEADTTLDRIVDAIVELAEPDEIRLFGSRARAANGTDSDYDVLVIKPGEYHKRDLATRIHRRLRGIRASVDLVLVTPDEAERNRSAWWTVIEPAMREGEVVYRRSA